MIETANETQPPTAGDPRRLDLVALDGGYGRLRVLHGVDLHVDEGEIVAVIGANGAGKSTLLRTIAGLLPPLGGVVRIRDGEEGRAAWAYAPEGRRLFPQMTVAENLELGTMRLPRRQRATGLQQRELVFDLFPILAEMRSRPAGALSGGQQQMVSLGRALMARPQLLLLDEPSMGLAPAPVAAILAALRRLADTGTAVLLVEQVVGLALGASDRAYVLRSGRVGLEGPSADLAVGTGALDAAYFGLDARRDPTSPGSPPAIPPAGQHLAAPTHGKATT